MAGDLPQTYSSESIYDIKNLWALAPDNFNKWRQEHDLPLLFNYFRKQLPGFSEWLAEYEPEKDYFLKIVPSGGVFKGDSDLVIVEYEQSNEKKVITKIVPSIEEIRRIQERFKGIKVDIKRTVPFVPYLLWGKRKFKKDRFIIHDKLNHQYSDTFVFNLWKGNDPTLSRAYLFKEFPVLKLGGIEIQSTEPLINPFGERNLDFVDLDYLKLNKMQTGSKWTEISYSSLRGVEFSNSFYAFFAFFNCCIEDMLIRDGRLQDFKFINNQHMNINFSTVSINKLVFDNSHVKMDFNNCNLGEILYKPPKTNILWGIFHNYRKLRTAYQNIGIREEARKYYYFERCVETKILASFITHYSESYLLKRNYYGTFFDILDQYRNGKFGVKESVSHFKSAGWYYLKICFIPKYFIRSLRYFSKFLFSFIDYLVWGYGEKPSRVFLFGLLIISVFSALFYHSNHPELHNSLINSIYFSVITFTTLGYGDINPNGYFDLRILCGLEALFGVLIVGLFVAGFANRSKY